VTDDVRIAAPRSASTVAGWMAVPLRVYFGAAFLYAASNKVGTGKWSQWPAAMQGFISGQLPHAAFFYRPMLTHVVLPHIDTWAPLVAVTEVIVGAALLLGVLTRVAAAVGIALTFNYFLLKGTSPIDVSNDLAFVFGLAVVIVSDAGRTLGVDGLRAPRD
jgi:thiosulfate dehydrogenase [quinone] large subunit